MKLVYKFLIILYHIFMMYTQLQTGGDCENCKYCNNNKHTVVFLCMLWLFQEREFTGINL